MSSFAPKTPGRTVIEILKVMFITMPMTAVVMFAVIGTLIFINKYYPDSTITLEDVMNYVTVGITVLLTMPLMQRGMHRYFWYVQNNPNSKIPPWGTAVPPVPYVKNPASIHLLRIALYLFAIISLLLIFAPLSHQKALFRTTMSVPGIHRNFFPFLQIVAYFLIFGFLLLIAFASTQYKKYLATRAVTEADMLRYNLNECWLFAFSVTYILTGLLCFIFGAMIIRTLT